MTELIFANNASSTTSGSILPTATTVNVSMGTGVLFPKPLGDQVFIASFIDQLTGTIREIVHVTNVTLDTMTIIRAQEGTNALAWPAGSIFAHLHTAGAMRAFFQEDDIPESSIIYVGVDTGVRNVVSVQATDPPIPTAPIPVNTLLSITIANSNTDVANMVVAPDPKLYPIERADSNVLHPNDIMIGQKALFIFTGIAMQLTNYKPLSPPDFKYPLDYWAGLFTGTPTQFSANVPAVVPYPYPAGLIITGLTSQINTGAIQVQVNNNPYVDLLYMDGSAFVGPGPGAPPDPPAEFHNLHTMLMMISDGTNFRALGSSWITLGGGGSAGSGGTPPAPVVDPSIFTYGNYKSVYVEEVSLLQTLPTEQYVPTSSIVKVPKESYGAAPQWQRLATWTNQWWLAPGQSNFDVITTNIFQRGSLLVTDFVYGDVGSLYAECYGAPGFAGTQDYTGRTMISYGPNWQAICYVNMDVIDPSGGPALAASLFLYQRLDNVNPVYGMAPGAIFIQGSSQSGSPTQDTVAMTTPVGTSYKGKTMGELGGTWMKIGTFTENYGGWSQADYVVKWYKFDIYQRIT
jgi:hypothetical protein